MANILLVEDELAFSQPEEEVLRREKHLVDWTDASSEAWKKLEEAEDSDNPYHLIIIDIGWIRRDPFKPPKRDEGLRLLKRLRRDKRFSQLPIIGTVSWFPPEKVNQTYQEQFISAGGDIIFEQKVDLEEFMDAVSKLLGGD